MKRLTLTILIITCIVFAIQVNAQTTEWKLKKSKNGISVYVRKIDDFPIKEFKASTILHTNFHDIIKILDNTTDYPKWMTDCLYAKTIKKVNDNERYVYLKAHLPWPLSDRDMIWQYKSKTDNKKEYRAVIILVPDYSDSINEAEGLERFKKGRGQWILKEINDQVEVTYQFAMDPGVPIPNWLINIFVVDGPLKTLGNLRALVEQN